MNELGVQLSDGWVIASLFDDLGRCQFISSRGSTTRSMDCHGRSCLSCLYTWLGQLGRAAGLVARRRVEISLGRRVRWSGRRHQHALASGPCRGSSSQGAVRTGSSFLQGSVCAGRQLLPLTKTGDLDKVRATISFVCYNHLRKSGFASCLFVF